MQCKLFFLAKEVFELMITDNRDPKVIVEEKGLVQESNVDELEKIISIQPVTSNHQDPNTTRIKL